MPGNENTYTTNNERTLSAVSNADGSTQVNLYANPTTHALITSQSGNPQPVTDFNYIDVQQTSSTVETYVYKQGGSGGTTVRTVVVTYVDSTKADIDTVSYS